MGDASDDYYNSMDKDFEIDELDPVRVEGKLIHATEKAYLWGRANHTNYWIPKSQVIDIDADYIVITGWLAGKKGWLE